MIEADGFEWLYNRASPHREVVLHFHTSSNDICSSWSACLLHNAPLPKKPSQSPPCCKTFSKTVTLLAYSNGSMRFISRLGYTEQSCSVKRRVLCREFPIAKLIQLLDRIDMRRCDREAAHGYQWSESEYSLFILN